MTVKKCDRCGAVYEYVLGAKKEATYQLRKKAPETVSNTKVIDLCPVCDKKLANWFEKCEG